MRKIFLLLAVITALYSCEKDESLSKSDLIINSWMLTETVKDSSILENDPVYLKNSIYTFYEDFTLELRILQSNDVVVGSWQLDEKENKLIIALPNVISEFKVIKITSTSLWLSAEMVDGTYLYKYLESEFIIFD